MEIRTFCVAGRTIACMLVLVTIASCALTPAPETPVVVARIQSLESFKRSLNGPEAATHDAHWWVRVGGEELDELVGLLRQDSLLLTESRLQAEQALERALQARGARFPGVTASADAAETRLPTFGGGSGRSENYGAGLLAGFDVDVFGRLRSTERSARLNSMAAELSFRAAKRREIAILARNWVAAATLQRRLELARDNAENFRQTHALTDQRYRAGSPSSSASDVQIALQNLDTALVDIPDLATQLETQLLVIDEQLARLPGESAAVFEGRIAASYSVNALPGKPASLLATRPDVAAAELRYRAALEDVGAARANLYPALTLSAAFTYQADSLDELFDWGQHIASLAGALTQPVFQGGRLKSQVRLERTRAEELATAFARTTLAALIDVETALAQLAGLGEQRDRLVDAVASAKTSNDIAQTRYRQGLASILAVLETQRSLNNAERNLILTEQALLNAQIDLFLSLGGDWKD
jgi:NodT family efflux transporter outer membrane factor (OMF) lipoprotein